MEPVQITPKASQDITKLAQGVDIAQVALDALKESKLTPNQVKQLEALLKTVSPTEGAASATTSAAGGRIETVDGHQAVVGQITVEGRQLDTLLSEGSFTIGISASATVKGVLMANYGVHRLLSELVTQSAELASRAGQEESPLISAIRAQLDAGEYNWARSYPSSGRSIGCYKHLDVNAPIKIKQEGSTIVMTASAIVNAALMSAYRVHRLLSELVTQSAELAAQNGSEESPLISAIRAQLNAVNF